MKKGLKKAGAIVAAGAVLLSQTQAFSIGAKADETAEPITIRISSGHQRFRSKL
ncbi:MAG: hypothetical protein V8S73_12605 [Lachnospiraceae bacterium]